jgi:hypothetical protein
MKNIIWHYCSGLTGLAHDQNRGSRSRRLAGRFWPADGGLSGKVGPASLPEPRGNLLSGRMGRGLNGAWLMTAMAVGVGEHR